MVAAVMVAAEAGVMLLKMRLTLCYVMYKPLLGVSIPISSLPLRYASIGTCGFTIQPRRPGIRHAKTALAQVFDPPVAFSNLEGSSSATVAAVLQIQIPRAVRHCSRTARQQHRLPSTCPFPDQTDP